jgi:hypothetical protein
MTMVLNSFTLTRFGEDVLITLVIIERYLGFSSLFLGVSMAIQPLMGTLRGESNTKSERYLMESANRSILIIGISTSLLTVIFAPFLVSILGIHEGRIFDLTVVALRISCAALFVQALLTLFFVYFFVTDRPGFSLLHSIPKDFAFPAGISIAFAFATGSEMGIWIGLMVAPVAAGLFASAVIYMRGGRDGFPYMIPPDRDALIHIYDFELNEKNIIDISYTGKKLAAESGYDEKVQMLVSLYLEDLLLLIWEKNMNSGNSILVECTLITEKDGLRLILRDSGIIFNLTDTDAVPDSFRQYIISSIMDVNEEKAYLKTTGYNRNEFIFS